MSDAFDWNAIDKSWGAVAAVEQDANEAYDTVPDGSYVCVVDKAEFRTSKSGNPYLNWVLVIEGGMHDGRWLFKRNMLATEQNMTFLKKDLAACNVAAPEKLSDLPLESLLDLKVRVTKKTKNDFENIYIDRLISEVNGGRPLQGKEFKDDDIPF